MRKEIIVLLIFFLSLFVNNSVFSETPSFTTRVYTEKTRLIVEKTFKDGSVSKKPYLMCGVTWSAATRAPDRGLSPEVPRKEVDYGYFFDWPGREPHGHDIFVNWMRSQYAEYYQIDIPLMKQMNVNTVRTYNDFGDEKAMYDKILDEFFRNGIMVILTVSSSKEDIESKRYLKVVRYCKDHPAILMWSLGNEWNLDYNRYYGYETVLESAYATNRVAKEIKQIDPNHPVSSCLGDRFTDKNPNNTIARILEVCPDVDIWGINAYRGKTFATLFDDWQALTGKPMYISEFGTDSFYTGKYKEVQGFQADDCQGYEDQGLQAEFIISQWAELVKHLSAMNPKNPCVGGLVHEFNDELWKVGSYHVTLGGLVDYEGKDVESYKEYNTEGFILQTGHPDGVANEEYFGLVNADRKPKKAFYKVGDYYKVLQDMGKKTKTPRLCSVSE